MRRQQRQQRAQRSAAPRGHAAELTTAAVCACCTRTKHAHTRVSAAHGTHGGVSHPAAWAGAHRLQAEQVFVGAQGAEGHKTAGRVGSGRLVAQPLRQPLRARHALQRAAARHPAAAAAAAAAKQAGAAAAGRADDGAASRIQRPSQLKHLR